jgi:hypothetical protein
MSLFGLSLRRVGAAVLALVALAAPQLALPAYAADITFVIRNNHPYAVRVELYSQNRNHVWPGGGSDFYLDDGEAREMPLSCMTGEQICYGAWLDGDEDTYWGVGPGNTEACDDCCYVCQGGMTEEIVLEE